MKTEIGSLSFLLFHDPIHSNMRKASRLARNCVTLLRVDLISQLLNNGLMTHKKPSDTQ